jgi:hypothetical protein
MTALRVDVDAIRPPRIRTSFHAEGIVVLSTFGNPSSLHVRETFTEIFVVHVSVRIFF